MLLATKVIDTRANDCVAAIMANEGGRLMVHLPSGTLEITQLQLSGKKRMAAADFLRGTNIEGWRL